MGEFVEMIPKEGLSLKTERRLIEDWLPLAEVNKNARTETGFIRVPKISNLHLWLARRPTCVARTLTLASTLPSSETIKMKLNELLGFNGIGEQPYRLLYLVDPSREAIKDVVKGVFNKDPKDIMVIDPMAGGGAIPLESLRLGLRTIAIEYNPVAYIILKATLEYPAKYGEKLFEDVREEVEAIMKYAKDELSKYYGKDGYMRAIFARGFQCPNCSGLVPIIYRTRLRRDGPYIKFRFNKDEKKFNVKVVDEETEYERLRCPYCDRPFTKNEVFSDWVLKHKEILKIALMGDVQEAQKYKDELLRTHIPLLKQTSRAQYAPCGKEDIDKFIDAYLDLAKQANEFKPYLPNSLIPKENKVFEPIRNLGIEHWYELFNPRQMLVFLKLVKYVNDRTKELIKDKGEYGAAVAVYLALGLDKIFDYNNIATGWISHRGVLYCLCDQYARKKSISLGLEYCEYILVPLHKSFGWAYEPDVEKLTATHGGVCPVLRQLCGWLYGLGDRIEVYMGDAREISKIVGEGNLDLVNVDPPYFNQHFYSDLSEFFWQGLMLALKPSIAAGYLFNRNKSRGKVECLVSGWSPSLPMVPRAGEIIVRRVKGKPNIVEVSFTKGWWKEQMWKFFTSCNNALKDDGMLIVWYTHSDPDAWEAVLSGLYASKFMVSKVWNMRTEKARRFITRPGGSAFFTSLALVARKTGESVIVGERSPKKLLFNEQVKEAITGSVIDALESARVSGASDREAYVMALAGAIAGATRIRNPALESIKLLASETLNQYTGETREQEIGRRMFNRTSDFFRESLYPVALYLGASKVLEEELTRAGLSEEQMKLIVGADDITKAYMVFWLSIRKVPFVDYDFTEKICKVVGTTVSTLETYGLIKKTERNAYLVTFGQEVFDAIRGRLEVLDRTTVGSAMYLIKLIVDSPIKDDEEKCARQVLGIKPVSKQAIATAMFLLRTAIDEELRKASVSQYTKPFIERVLKALYAR